MRMQEQANARLSGIKSQEAFFGKFFDEKQYNQVPCPAAPCRAVRWCAARGEAWGAVGARVDAAQFRRITCFFLSLLLLELGFHPRNSVV